MFQKNLPPPYETWRAVAIDPNRLLWLLPNGLIAWAKGPLAEQPTAGIEGSIDPIDRITNRPAPAMLPGAWSAQRPGSA
jgi:hypothetical protein